MNPVVLKILILGGTHFLGIHLMQELLDRGHEVTLCNRGNQKTDPFPNVEKLKGDRDSHLETLLGRKWDAVIDTSGHLSFVVEPSAKILANATNHYFTKRTENSLNTSTTPPDLYSVLESLGQKCQNPAYGKKLYGPLKTAEQQGIQIVFIPAFEQDLFNFVEGLQHICSWMGLDKDSQVWWIGGDLTGIYQEEGTQKAIHALEVFASRFFQDGMGNMRKDRLMISEYAGPERNYGKECCAIRCVAKMIEKMPEIANSILPYGVVNSAAWFKSIDAVPQNGAKYFYVVHGDRPGCSDPWDSNGLARNALILEGGSRTLGYIFDIIANGGQVIGLYGFRENASDFFDTKSEKPTLSAAKFVGELCEYLTTHPDAENHDVMRFWNEYTSVWLPYNPNASDAHTKQYFIDAAWDVFKTHKLKDKIASQFKCYPYDSFIQECQHNHL